MSIGYSEDLRPRKFAFEKQELMQKVKVGFTDTMTKRVVGKTFVPTVTKKSHKETVIRRHYVKPDKVNILGKEYSIEYVNKPSEVDIYKRESLWGQIDYWTRSIRVYDNGRNVEDMWQTIIHEVLHGICSSLNLDLDKANESEDTIDLLALALTDVFFRNGWFRKDLDK